MQWPPESNIYAEVSSAKQRSPQFTNELSLITYNSQHELPSSALESSEFAVVRPTNRVGERISTILHTSESVLSRNRLQECSVHLERFCEQANTLVQSKKFEDRMQIVQIPGLHVPLFTSHPTIAFCSKCGRDVKTKILKVEKKFLGVRFNDFFCCFPSIAGEQEFMHVCSRCKNQLVKIML